MHPHTSYTETCQASNTNYYINSHPKIDNLLLVHVGKVRTIVGKNRINSSLYYHKVFLLRDQHCK